MAERELQAIIARALTGDNYEGLMPPVVDDEVYGAYWIDPALLTVQCLFEDNAALAQAEQNGTCRNIRRRIKKALRREGYPARGVKGMKIGFDSNQAVDETGGSWRYFR